ncbi:MAG TPA: GTP cyclohydrolase MptA [Thermoplasmata archaeon]|nr:GTP cyclohydrolase MptA [Thermoplasmata archaeon]
MPDIHAQPPATGRLTLEKVGISGIRKPLRVERPGRVHTLSAAFSVSVDLPAERKGSDLSRNAALLAEAFDWPEARPVPSLESACVGIARELLTRHPYATTSEVTARAEYFLPRGIAPGRSSLENFTLLAEAYGVRRPEGIRVRRTVGAEAVGMTACPCAMESARERLVEEFPKLADPQLAGLPIVTHNQRNRTELRFELSEGAEVEADEIVAAIEAAQSSPTYAILKRGDEAQLVLHAHRNPKFVEDVVRDLVFSLPSRFPTLDDAVVVRVHSVSEESIHKFDVVADHRVTMGDLRTNGRAP